MKTYCLVVHNSDEVKAVFVGDTLKSIMKRVMNTKHGADIEKRSIEYYNDDKKQDAEEENKEWVDVEEIPWKDVPHDMIKYMIERLYHDGDSEDGYTLFDTDLSENTVLYFKDN